MSWISFAEFGRAVAEERARVAREIHDGLAQYLFAVSTHATMLQQGAPQEETLTKLKEAADAAQQEARGASCRSATTARASTGIPPRPGKGSTTFAPARRRSKVGSR
ncbi:MAG: histidine kinase dimerization/phosphoacceptor domain-containing protein [Actinobacteria bacterium]|nr:histidine kinase dimerization/phosphoacceptor domain-containing protein [Actinomycetota bacterium]